MMMTGRGGNDMENVPTESEFCDFNFCLNFSSLNMSRRRYKKDDLTENGTQSCDPCRHQGPSFSLGPFVIVFK